MDDKVSPPEHGAKIKAALDLRADHRLNLATKRAQAINEGGKFIPMVTDEQWDEILERIANGEIGAHVMKSLGLSAATLTAKCRRDPAFNERYKDALEDHYVNIAEDLRMVTRGVPGYSTGDVRRDELVAKYDLALARSFANRVLGERVQVDQTVSVAPVMLPTIALHGPDIEDRARDDETD